MIEASGIFGTWSMKLRCHFIRFRFASRSFFGESTQRVEKESKLCRVFFAGETKSKIHFMKQRRRKEKQRYTKMFSLSMLHTRYGVVQANPIVTPIKLLNYTYIVHILGLTILDLFLFLLLLLLLFFFCCLSVLSRSLYVSFGSIGHKAVEKKICSVIMIRMNITNWILLRKKGKNEVNTAQHNITIRKQFVDLKKSNSNNNSGSLLRMK